MADSKDDDIYPDFIEDHEKCSADIAVSMDVAAEHSDQTILQFTLDVWKQLLLKTTIQLDTNIILYNSLSLSEKIELSNWFVTQLSKLTNDFETIMTLNEFISLLEKLKEVDPKHGEIEITLKDGIEIEDVMVMENGEDKHLEII